MRVNKLVSEGVLVLLAAGMAVRADFPVVALEPVSLGRLQAPVCVASAHDGSGRLFVCEQRGQVRVIRNGAMLPQPFLDISDKLVPERQGFDERGLLGLAFHPGYTNAASPGYRKFYVFYSAVSPNAPGTTNAPVDCRSTIAEYQVSTGNVDVAESTSERIVLAFDKPQFNHNGGQLDFGPDGLLYISTGDGGGANDNRDGHTGGSGTTSPGLSGVLGNSQDTTRLLGKILRIDPLGSSGPGGQYGIPPSNPFVGQGDGVREEIFAFGLRNPWRFSFDIGPGGTDRLFVADVGQGRYEEINIVTNGGNYGWRVKEGEFDFDATAPNGGLPLIDPVAQYAHPGITTGPPQIGLSVTGGYVYRGSAIPGLVGKYVFGDWSSSFGTPGGTLLGLEETAPNTWSLAFLRVIGGNPFATRIMAFGRDEQGELYVATKVTLAPTQSDPATGLPSGGIFKIVPAVAATNTLAPSKDNTIFSENPLRSNALGNLFSGRAENFVGTQGDRRALLAFDLSGQLPAGAIVTSAALSLKLNKTAAVEASPMWLHRLTADWGEGTSDAGNLNDGTGAPATVGDATWTRRFYDTVAWATNGGTYAPAASATTTVGTVSAVYMWTSPQLAADVQSWVTNAATNLGWILVGDESTKSARRFDSRETASGTPPQLQITYATAPAESAFVAVTLLTNRSVQTDLIGTVACAFTINATTNLLLPATNWMELGTAVELAPGWFRFTDADTTNQMLRFYRAHSQ